MMTLSFRSVLLVLLLVLGLEPTSSVTAQHPQDSKVLVRMLEEQIHMKDFWQPMNLRETLELLMQKFAEKGKDLRIVVDADTLTRAIGGDVYQTLVHYSIYPKKLAARTVLEIALSKVEPANAAYTVRRGTLFVTTKELASFDHLRMEKVRGTYSNQPLADVFDDLADQIGVDITVDKRCLEKAKNPVTAVFRNSTLEDAVTLLADQADLKAVALPSGFYVTSRENAERLQQELNRSSKAGSKEKDKAAVPK